MTTVYLILIIYTLLHLHVSVDARRDYLNRDQTDAVKGFFTVLVFCRHFIAYKPPFPDTIFYRAGLLFNHCLGQLIVVMFLFYSGYGIMEAAAHKGEDYIHRMPQSKLGRTLLRFDAAVCVYLVVRLIRKPQSVTLKKAVMAFFALESVGNSCWYIFCILAMYLISYLVLRRIRPGRRAAVTIFAGATFYMIAIALTGHDHTWYDTAWCFALGALWSAEKETVERWTSAQKRTAAVIAAALFLGGYIGSYLYPAQMSLMYPPANLSFCFLTVMITRHVRLESGLLRALGRALFPIYMYQRLPMLLLKRVSVVFSRPYLYFVLCAVLTCIAAAVEQKCYRVVTGRRADKALRRSGS